VIVFGGPHHKLCSWTRWENFVPGSLMPSIFDFWLRYYYTQCSLFHRFSLIFAFTRMILNFSSTVIHPNLTWTADFFQVDSNYRYLNSLLFIARSKLLKILFLAPSVCVFCFVYEIPREPLNGFAPNSHGRRVWSLARTSLKVKVRGHQGKRFSALSAACVRSLAALV